MKETLTKEVEVCGEKFTVQYFKLEYNSKSHLSFLDKITIHFCHLKHKIRNILYETKYGFERMFKGYDSIETFNLYSKFIDRYRKILAEYMNNLHSHPGNMTEEEWQEILEEMIMHLDFMDEEKVDRFLMKDLPEEWIPSMVTSYEIIEKHKNEFFKLFSQHFYVLWD